MEHVDDRTPGQMCTHYWLVIGTDRVLSGWGLARAGTSVAAWACKPEHREKVLAWVGGRTDMKRVRESCEATAYGGERDESTGYLAPTKFRRWRAKNAAHVHVYVVDDAHPAVQ